MTILKLLRIIIDYGKDKSTINGIILSSIIFLSLNVMIFTVILKI